jgi:hypothetical protein
LLLQKLLLLLLQKLLVQLHLPRLHLHVLLSLHLHAFLLMLLLMLQLQQLEVLGCLLLRQRGGRGGVRWSDWRERSLFVKCLRGRRRRHRLSHRQGVQLVQRQRTAAAARRAVGGSVLAAAAAVADCSHWPVHVTAAGTEPRPRRRGQGRRGSGPGL